MKKVRTHTYCFFVSFLTTAIIFATVLVSPAHLDAAASIPAVERDILASGKISATDLYIIDSRRPGPVVMIVGGVHGSEKAGIAAATKYTSIKIKKGKLLVIPEANSRAAAVNKRTAPNGTDLNRSFPQKKTENADTYIARDIYAAVKSHKVDWLMDMHEGFDYYKNTGSNSVGQTLIYYPSAKMTPMAKMIVNTVNQSINKSYYYKFALLKYPVKGSLARSSAQFLGVNAFIFETSQKQTLYTRVNQQCIAADKLLKELDML